MRVLITGATGRVGANLAMALAERGDEAICMVMPDDPKAGKLEALDVQIKCADLCDTESIAAAAQGAEQIVHAAALMGQPTVGAEAFLDVNVMGTQRMLQAALDSEVERFVYISSTAIYCTDRATVHPTAEDTRLDPLGLYGASKKMAEALVENYHREHGLPYVILRPSDIRACDEILNGWTVKATLGIYKRGARDPLTHFYVPDDAEPWRELEKLAEEHGNALCAATDAAGQPWERHSTDVRDVVGAILAALDSDAALGGIFNVAAPEPMPMPEVAQYIASKTGDRVVPVATPSRRRVNLSVERLRGIFYEPLYDYERMIDDALRFRDEEDVGVIPA